MRLKSAKSFSMNRYAILHIPDIPYAYPEDENTLIIRLRTKKNDLRNCTLFYKDRYDWETPFNSKTMLCAESTSLFDYYSASVSIDQNRYRYFFKMEDASGKIAYLDERGITEVTPAERGSFQFPYIAQADVYHGVKWAQEGVVYQIFPDRFFNGDKSNDPKNCLPWGEQVNQKSVFGGDISGIIKKIPYLKELGVTFLYLTPIFLSSSNHKYDTDDYYQVDPHFGTAEEVRRMVEVCHENNIQILFDAVFNQCSANFFAFQDVLKNGAASEYKDWFFIQNFPVEMEKVNYITFSNGQPNMPKLNTANPEVSNYLLKIAEYWMLEMGIDGWRLDVCDEIDHVFWREFRKKIKTINPQAMIVGEIQHEASSFLRGDQMDCIMNYPFHDAAVSFFAERSISPIRFEDELTDARMHYMDQINRSMLNLIGSHDTERFLTLCSGKTERLMCAAVFQFTYIGIPYIYYGDEIGLDGGYDPLCRKCMVWDEEKQDQALFSLYKKLCKIRKENPCLVYGDYCSLSDIRILAYRRVLGNESVFVAINNRDEPNEFRSKALQGRHIDLMKGQQITLNGRLELKASEFRILKPVKL